MMYRDDCFAICTSLQFVFYRGCSNQHIRSVETSTFGGTPLLTVDVQGQ